MEISPRAPLDPEALADGGERLAGHLDAALFDRRLGVALAMDRTEGEVAYELDFRRLANGAVAVSGRLQARLAARCQRCLEPFELTLETIPRVVIPAGGSAPAMEEGWESIESGIPPSLAAFIEDELLLGLPWKRAGSRSNPAYRRVSRRSSRTNCSSACR